MAFILIATLMRLLFAASLGLGIDEAYAVATGRVFDWSYLDHPPLSWWLASASAHLFGSEAAIVVRLPFILLFGLSSWLMFRLTSLLFTPLGGLYAAMLMNLAPALGVSDGTFVLPDGPLVAALLGGAICLVEIFFGKHEGKAGPWWIGAGVCSGLAMLSKYHGVFLPAGAGLFMLTVPAQRRWFASPWPYVAGVVALAMFTPVVVWNVQHDWASFAFQGGRAVGSHFRPWMALLMIGGNALFLTPWIWWPLVLRGWEALRAGTESQPTWLLLCLACGPILTFTLLPGLTGNRGLFHWAVPGYLMLFPLLGDRLSIQLVEGERRARRWYLATAAITPLLLTLVVIFALMPWPGLPFGKPGRNDDPLTETLEWSNLRPLFEGSGLARRSDVFVATERWHEAGRADYALRGVAPVTCLCDDSRGYGIQQPLSKFVGRNAILIFPSDRAADVETRFGKYFDDIQPWTEVTVDHGGEPSFSLKLFIGRHFSLSR